MTSILERLAVGNLEDLENPGAGIGSILNVWIREHIASEKVLVACHYGLGRWPSVIIGYLCSIGFGYKGALNFVSPKRPGINPIPHLEETIRESLNNLGGGTEMRIAMMTAWNTDSGWRSMRNPWERPGGRWGTT